MEFERLLVEAIAAIEARWQEHHRRHVSVISEYLIRMEQRIMDTVTVSQEQITELQTSVSNLQAQVAPLHSDGQLMLGLITDLRASLATALAAGTAPTLVDLSSAISSIDSVTKQLSADTTTDDAILNPPAPVVGTPPPGTVVDPAAPVAPVGAINDLNPNAGVPVAGNVQDHPGNAAPQDPDDASIPPAAPNAGDPTGTTIADSTSPVAPGTTSADLGNASTGTNDTSPGVVNDAEGVDGSGAPRTQNAS